MKQLFDLVFAACYDFNKSCQLEMVVLYLTVEENCFRMRSQLYFGLCDVEHKNGSCQ